MKLLLILFFSIFFKFKLAFAAACCGGSSSTPAIITGDDKAQLSVGLSLSQVVVDNIDNEGIWYNSDAHQVSQTLKIQGSHLISDRWQMGVSLPLIHRELGQLQFSGIGDLNTNIGYEFLPEWDYNPYRPKGVVFAVINCPTGKSKMESTQGGLDSTGSGFWSAGAGVVLNKIIRSYDLLLSWDWHHSFGAKTNSDQVKGVLIPGNGNNFSAGLGYNWSNLRLGYLISWLDEDPILNTLEPSKTGYRESYATASISLSYLEAEDLSHIFTYSDQTWFGTPQNTSLARSINYLIQKRWGR